MKNIFLLLATLITFSCNKSHIENFENTDITNTAKNHAIKTPTRRQTQPISYELIKNMSMENAVRDYPPIAAETFILGKEGGFITEFRTGLLDIFKTDEIKKKKKYYYQGNNLENQYQTKFNRMVSRKKYSMVTYRSFNLGQ